MKSIAILALAVLLAAACANTNPTPSAAPRATPSTPDTDLGLVKGSAFDVPTPPAVRANESGPGEQPVLARPYAIAPPRVPHAVAGFLPITLTQNACVDCHGVTERKKGEPTPLPPNHYTDFRNAPDRVGRQPVGARHACLSCHVSTTDAPDLVENRFR